MSSNVRVMALTATASASLRQLVEQILGMTNPVRIIESPDKINIRYAAVEVKSKQESLVFKPILEELRQQRVLFRRAIIFCKYKADCFNLYTYFQVKWGVSLQSHRSIAKKS